MSFSKRFHFEIAGITISLGELFIMFLNDKHVHVYDSLDFTPKRTFALPAGERPFWDLVSSDEARVLYVSDWHGNIDCVKSFNGVLVYSMRAGIGQASLSITVPGILLASSSGVNTLYEFKTAAYEPGDTSRILKVINLQVGEPCSLNRAVKLHNDQFLVSQAVKMNAVGHRVCLFDDTGRVLKSFGGAPGAGETNLHGPYRMVVDRNGYILVADFYNNRVVVLNKQLEYVKSLNAEPSHNFSPFTLFLDENNKKLYVSESEGHQLLVYQLAI